MGLRRQGAVETLAQALPHRQPLRQRHVVAEVSEPARHEPAPRNRQPGRKIGGHGVRIYSDGACPVDVGVRLPKDRREILLGPESSRYSNDEFTVAQPIPRLDHGRRAPLTFHL